MTILYWIVLIVMVVICRLITIFVVVFLVFYYCRIFWQPSLMIRLIDRVVGCGSCVMTIMTMSHFLNHFIINRYYHHHLNSPTLNHHLRHRNISLHNLHHLINLHCHYHLLRCHFHPCQRRVMPGGGRFSFVVCVVMWSFTCLFIFYILTC